MAFTTVTITRDYDLADGTDPTGTVTFTPTSPMVNGPTVVAAPVVVRLDVDGLLTIDLAANTDAATLPAGVTYLVEEVIAGATRKYYVQIPHDQGSSLDLSTLTSVGVAPAISFPAQQEQSVIAVDNQTGATDTAKMQAAITNAAAAIVSGNGPVEIRMSGRAYTWDTAVPTIPCNLTGQLRINGAGARVTLSSSAAAFLEISKQADYDVFRNVEICDVSIDADNVAGFGHAIIGTCAWNASTLTTHNRVGVDNVRVSRVKVTNLPTAWADTDLRAGVYFMASLSGTAGETAISVTNVVVEDVRVEGGRFGVAVGARFTTSGRVYIDNCHINRCWHDTGATPSNFLGCTNFFLGGRGYGGYGSVTNCYGKNSGDDGVEINGLENVLVDNCVIEDAANVAYLHHNFSTPNKLQSQKIKIRDSHARVIALTTSASMPGRGFLLNTHTVASTTTSSVSAAATTIPLTSVAPVAGDVFFPTSGTVTDGAGQTITYTGISSNTLTGCSGVSGLSNGATVTLVNDTQNASIEGCSFYKQGQTYWETTGDAFRVSGPIRNLTIREFSYTGLTWAAVIGSAAVPVAFYINAVPTDPLADTQIRLDNIRIKMTGARSSGSTADWIGFDISGLAPFVTATGIEIDNAMTGMSAANDIDGFRFGRASNGVHSAVIKGFKIKSLGDVGSIQKGTHTGTSTAVGNNCLFDFSGLEFTGLLSGAVDVYSASGGQVKTRTFVENTLSKSAGLAPHVTITATTGTFQYQNINQRRGVIVVSGGTVTNIQLGSTSGALVTTGLTTGAFFVGPGDYIQVTNSVAPTMTFIPFQ